MRTILPAIGAGALYLALTTLLNFSVPIAGGIAVLSFVGGRIALSSRKKRAKSIEQPVKEVIKIDVSAFGIDQEEFDTALREGSRKLAVLNASVSRIADQRVRAKGQAICDLVARILSSIRQDPKDLRPARKFLDYYLDATVKVVEQYVHISSRGARSAETMQTLSRVEESLETIRSAYQKQLEQLLQNDVMDLDAELKVLEQTIKMEGLGGDL